MKIMHICLNGVVTDGFLYQDNLLPKFHKKLGHDVVLLTSLYAFNSDGKIILLSQDKMEYINDDGVKVIRVPMKKNQTQLTKLKHYKNFTGILKQEAPDIIFIHDFQYPDVEIIRKYMRQHKNVIAYADNHADYSNSATSWLSKNILHKIIWRYYAKRIESYVKKFYGVLPARVDFMVELYKLPAKKCELLVMGADDDLVKEADTQENKLKMRNKYGIAQDDFLIVTGGKIDAYKTQTLLLMEAVRNICNSNIKLIVFGSVEEELKNKVNLLVDDKKVKYIGWVEPKDSYNYFAMADLAVFPGRHSVFWEQAAGQGIPMVVKHWEGTHHVDVGGNVKFIYHDDESEIRKILQEILSNKKEYKRMKEIAMIKAKPFFSYMEIAKKSIE